MYLCGWLKQDNLIRQSYFNNLKHIFACLLLKVLEIQGGKSKFIKAMDMDILYSI